MLAGDARELLVLFLRDDAPDGGARDVTSSFGVLHDLVNEVLSRGDVFVLELRPFGAVRARAVW